MRNLHELQIKTAVEAVASRKEVNEVYFVACGGSQAVLMAGQYLFDKESSVPSHVYTANEFVYDTPKNQWLFHAHIQVILQKQLLLQNLQDLRAQLQFVYLI